MIAKDKEEYIKAWKHHIQELNSLSVHSGATSKSITRWRKTREELYTLVETAAAHKFASHNNKRIPTKEAAA